MFTNHTLNQKTKIGSRTTRMFANVVDRSKTNKNEFVATESGTQFGVRCDPIVQDDV